MLLHQVSEHGHVGVHLLINTGEPEHHNVLHQSGAQQERVGRVSNLLSLPIWHNQSGGGGFCNHGIPLKNC